MMIYWRSRKEKEKKREKIDGVRMPTKVLGFPFIDRLLINPLGIYCFHSNMSQLSFIFHSSCQKFCQLLN